MTNFAYRFWHIQIKKLVQYLENKKCIRWFMKKKIFIVLLALVLLAPTLAGCLNSNFVSKYGTNITSYDIELSLEENNKISGNQTTKFKNTTSNILQEVYFHLYPNSFQDVAMNKPVSKLYESKAYPNGFSSGKIEIKSVNSNGKEVSFALENLDKDLLKVTLLAPLYPNDFVSISMEYDITIPNVNHRFGWNDNTINLGNIYPVACVFDENGWDKHPYNSNGDPFYSNLANYSVKFTYPKDMTLAHTGIETEKQTNETTTTIKMQANAVRDFAMVLSSKFQTKSCNVNGTEITYYFYDDAKSDESLSTAQKALSTFNQKYGNYPYSTLEVVQTGFVYGGMEYPNLVMISDSLEKYDDYTITIIHEIAHQWWYGVVGNNQYDYGWLDESLAEYSVVVFYENNPEYEIKRDVCIQNAITSYTLFVDVYKDVFNEVDTSMNRSLDKFATEPEYVYASYVKGMIMFDDIRNLIGDKKFFDSLKNYYKQYAGKNATPNNLINVFEDTSHRRLKAIFESYLDGSAIIGNVNQNSKTAQN